MVTNLYTAFLSYLICSGFVLQDRSFWVFFLSSDSSWNQLQKRANEMNTPILPSSSFLNGPTKTKTNYQNTSDARFCKTEMQRPNAFAPCHEPSVQFMCYRVMKEFLKIMLQNGHSYSHGMDNQDNTVARNH